MQALDATTESPDRSRDPSMDSLINRLGIEPQIPITDVVAEPLRPGSGASNTSGSLANLHSEIVSAMKFARDEQNAFGLLLLSALNTAVTSVAAFRDDVEGNEIASLLQGGGDVFARVAALIGAGDVAAFGAVISDIGTTIASTSAEDRSAIATAGASVRTLGSTLRALGQNGDDDGLIIAGMILSGVGDVLQKASVEKETLFRLGPDGRPVEVETRPDLDTAVTAANAVSQILGYLGEKGNDPGLTAAAQALSGGFTAYRQFELGQSNLGTATTVATASGVIGTLLGGDTGRIISGVGNITADVMRLTSGSVSNAGAGWAGMALQLADVLGLDIPPEIRAAISAGIAAFTGPLAVGAFFVGLFFNAMNMGVINREAELFKNLDLDGDGVGDDGVDLLQKYHRGFWGRTELVNSQLEYNIDSTNPRFMKEMLYQLDERADGTASLRLLVVYDDINPEVADVRSSTFELSAEELATFKAERAESLKDYNLTQTGFGTGDTGVFIHKGDEIYQAEYYPTFSHRKNYGDSNYYHTSYYNVGPFGPTDVARALEKDGTRTIQNLIPSHEERLSGVSRDVLLKVKALGDSDRFPKENKKKHVLRDMEFGQEHIQTWNIVKRNDPMRTESAVLNRLLSDPSIANISDVVDKPDLYFYADLNGDGNLDLIRNGLQGEVFRRDGDGKVQFWLLDEDGRTLGDPISQYKNIGTDAEPWKGGIGSVTVSNIDEAVEVAGMAELLFQWAAARPRDWGDRVVTRHEDGYLYDSRNRRTPDYIQGQYSGLPAISLDDILARAKQSGAYDDLKAFRQLQSELGVVLVNPEAAKQLGVNPEQMITQLQALVEKIGPLFDVDGYREALRSRGANNIEVDDLSNLELMNYYITGGEGGLSSPGELYNKFATERQIGADGFAANDIDNNGVGDIVTFDDTGVTVTFQSETRNTGTRWSKATNQIQRFGTLRAGSYAEASEIGEMRAILELWAQGVPELGPDATLNDAFRLAESRGLLDDLDSLNDRLASVGALPVNRSSEPVEVFSGVASAKDQVIARIELVGRPANELSFELEADGAAVDLLETRVSDDGTAVEVVLPKGALFDAGDTSFHQSRFKSNGHGRLFVRDELTDREESIGYMISVVAEPDFVMAPLRSVRMVGNGPKGYRDRLPTQTGDRLRIGQVFPEGSNITQVIQTLDGEHADLFEIDGTVLYLKGGQSIDFDANPTLNLTVTTRDRTGKTVESNLVFRSQSEGDAPMLKMGAVQIGATENLDTTIQLLSLNLGERTLPEFDATLQGEDQDRVVVNRSGTSDLSVSAKWGEQYQQGEEIDFTLTLRDRSTGAVVRQAVTAQVVASEALADTKYEPAQPFEPVRIEAADATRTVASKEVLATLTDAAIDYYNTDRPLGPIFEITDSFKGTADLVGESSATLNLGYRWIRTSPADPETVQDKGVDQRVFHLLREENGGWSVIGMGGPGSARL